MTVAGEALAEAGPARLAPDHLALAETATDVLELTALLESEGLTDLRVEESYGHESVFAYARELFAQAPRRPVAAAVPPPPRTFSPARSTARLRRS